MDVLLCTQSYTTKAGTYVVYIHVHGVCVHANIRKYVCTSHNHTHKLIPYGAYISWVCTNHKFCEFGGVCKIISTTFLRLHTERTAPKPSWRVGFNGIGRAHSSLWGWLRFPSCWMQRRSAAEHEWPIGPETLPASL